MRADDRVGTERKEASSMLLAQVALVSETNQITAAQLSRVTAALQKQVTRDFGPLWNAVRDAQFEGQQAVEGEDGDPVRTELLGTTHGP
ncbi:hypothetical protein AB0C13_35780, partial [Streptomyces sp. NPDC049099]